MPAFLWVSLRHRRVARNPLNGECFYVGPFNAISGIQPRTVMWSHWLSMEPVDGLLEDLRNPFRIPFVDPMAGK